MKIMIYCQHVLGIGHFFRAMEIARALADHQVLFVEGGEPLGGYKPPPNVERFFLPPLMMDAQFKTMETKTGDLESLKFRRKELLLQCIENFEPHVFITELFPFGRRQFRFELIPALQKLKEAPKHTWIVCSLRDILVEKSNPEDFENWVLKTLNTYYDLLLIHSDPRIAPLDETFSQFDRISVPWHYTGFIARSHSGTTRREDNLQLTGEKDSRSGLDHDDDKGFRQPSRRIVVSSGGGKVGADLLSATLLAVQSMPDKNLRLKAFMGPFMDETEKRSLRRLAGLDPRTSLHPFSYDFPSELARSDLSISMAGYNTCMDILSTRVKALLMPFPQNREQAMRAGKLEAMGLVRILKNLDPEHIARAIRKALEDGWPAEVEPPVNLSGASATARYIESLFDLK